MTTWPRSAARAGCCPLSPALFPFVHTSRFGVIPKGTTGKWRLIVDMSFLKGSSVNDGIREAVSSHTYVGIGDAMKVIVQLGKGTLLAKADIRVLTGMSQFTQLTDG